MTTFDVALETRWSGSISRPTEADITKALTELEKSDPEHPNTWLTNEDGDVLEAFEDFTVRLYNLDIPEKALTSKKLPLSKIQQLWLLFAKGDVEKVKELM